MPKPRILLVDDEERFRTNLQRMLDAQGLTVKAAGSGADALEELAHSPYDVIVLDIRMPGMDGLAALKEIKQLNPEVEVIILSGHASMDAAMEINRLTGQDIMYQQFGYLMRSGAPDSLDRMVAMSFGHLAIQLIQRGETGKMVALKSGRYTTVPVDMIMAGKKRVDVENFYDIDNYRPRVKDFMGVPMFLS